MKINLSDEEWVKVYPLFGFLYGRFAISAHKRQAALFDHDSELAFIMRALADLNFHHYYSPANMERIVENGVSFEELSTIKQVPVSALSLASILNIPRESARRKLKRLVSMGLVVQEGGGYFSAPKTLQYYFNESRRIYEDFARTANTIGTLQRNARIE